MEILKNNYQKTMGFARCRHCGSVLKIHKTDLVLDRNERVFYCGACNWRHVYRAKDMMSQKKAMEASDAK